MQITNLTPQENSQLQTNQTQIQEKPVQSGEQQKLVQSGELSLYNAPKGSAFQGDILNVQGNQVSIQVGKYILNAVLENGMNVNIGDRLSFLVKDNTGAKILLKPFIENGESIQGNNMQNSLIKTLEEASLPVTERSMAAVKEMMSYGMPIDKNSMADIGRLLSQFKSANVETIISLKSHNIPVTQENITQFEAYKNAEGKLLDQMKGIVKELSSMVENGETMQSLEKTGELFGKLKELFQSVGNQIETPDGRVTVTVPKTADTGEMTQEAGKNMEVLNPESGKISEESVKLNQQNSQLDNKSVLHENIQTDSKTEPHEAQQTDSKNTLHENLQTNNKTNQLENQQILNQSADKTILEMKQHLSDEVKKIETAIKEKLLLTPEQLAKKGEKAVKELYENIAKTADKMTELLEASGEGKSKLMTAAGDLKNNMNFMSDLNEMAAYVQLPVKLNGREQTGELYVLSRKKNKSSKDGPLTAFLHLDMEYLGATDVKVSLVNGKVSTKFTLDNDASIKLVEVHLPELKKRLEELGYSVSLSVDEITEKKLPFEQILEAEKPAQNIKRFSFDVRA
ncbi:MAG: flagellar hook-length control protein FliK [Lachnospiraceae bacterium]|nr:flagellar hook-length control protein FliK [Lachnospiraceae bacterium]